MDKRASKLVYYFLEVALKLSPSQVELLGLLLDGWSRQEIAQKLNVPIGTVDSRLHRMKSVFTT